ncbi:MAG: hypothetical protein ACJAWH_001809 [Maribacter sp.]|jgi:hypothetical protein
MKHVTNSLTEYLDGLLDQEECAAIASHLKECSTCKQELEHLKALFGAFEQEEVLAPSKRVRENFLVALKTEQTSKVAPTLENDIKVLPKKSGVRILLKIAAGIALLFGAFMLGRNQNERQANQSLSSQEYKLLEIQQTAMISLMGNQSPSKRIQGVNLITKFENPDEEIINALVNRLLLDENMNVRLTAVEALAMFAKSETVKSAFIKVLATEKDPSLQIAIIHNLVRIQAQNTAKPMKYLLEQEDTQPFVKEEINRVLAEII